MKILIAASSMVHINNFHRPYIEALRALGHQVYIMARGEGADFNIELKKRSLSFTNFRLSFKIKRIIMEEEFDAIYLHTSLAAFWVRAALVGVKKRPYVINTVHGYLFGSSSGKLHNAVYLFCEKVFRKKTDDIIVMNEEDYKIATDNNLCRGNVYMSNGMGVDFNEFDLAESQKEKGKISLAYVGELSQRKNQMFLVKAMEKLKNYTLTLIGDGDARGEIEGYIKRKGLENRVSITGFTKDVSKYINNCDIYVSASKIEGLPFNIMEAMYLKKPIVASNIKGQRDLLPSSSLYELGNMDEYVSLVENTVIKKVDYNIQKYSIEEVLGRNLEYYVKTQPTVEEKQPTVY